LNFFAVSGRARRPVALVTIAAEVNAAYGSPSTAIEVRSAHLPASRRSDGKARRYTRKWCDC